MCAYDTSNVVVAIFGQGPLHGLRLTLNVQQYENLPFLHQDSGIKASLSSAI